MSNLKSKIYNRFVRSVLKIKPKKDKVISSKFVRSLSEHFGFDVTKEIEDPLFKMYVSFALSANDRGRDAVGKLGKYTSIKGKRFLDVGCAYGGFLVAFAEQGASEVVGIDIDEKLLKLGCANVSDHNIEAKIIKQDLLNDDLPNLIGTFDIITCNDVIEHVNDPIHAILNISNLLRPGGILLMVIPNAFYVGFIREDGHFRLTGINLLERDDAERYYKNIFKGEYTVGHYKSLPFYFYHLIRSGITPRLISAPTINDLAALKDDFEKSIKVLDSFDDPRVDQEIKEKIKMKSRIFEKTFIRA
jgi:2-polyprenyl-3-methyl-5-hydroxy-6-metoxy-1,4-benzoquinol methylase